MLLKTYLQTNLNINMKRITLLVICAIFTLQLSVIAGDRYHYDKTVSQMDAGNVSCIPYNTNQLPTPFRLTPLDIAN